MKDLERMLKDGAKDVLPNEKFKNKVVFDVAERATESETVAITAGGGNIKRTGVNTRAVLAIIIAFVLCVSAAILIFTVNGFDGAPINNFTHVSIDVNPSVEIVLDENDNVKDVYGLNQEGAILVYGEKFSKNKELTVQRIVELMQKCGYFENNNKMRLLVDGKENKEEELYIQLRSAIEVSFNNLQVACTIEGVPEDIKEQAKNHGMSSAKYYLAYLLAQENDNDIEDYFDEDFEELHKLEKHYNFNEIESALNGMKNDVLETCVEKLERLDAVEDLLEEVLDLIEDGKEYKNALRRLNEKLKGISDIFGYIAEFDENSYKIILITMLEDFEERLEEAIDTIEDIIDNEKKNFIDMLPPRAPQSLPHGHRP